MKRLLLVTFLAACTPASASAPVLHTKLPATCDRWPRETTLALPTDTVGALDWHKENWARARAAHDDCRDKYNALVRRINEGRL